MKGMMCQSNFRRSFLVALRSYPAASLISTTDAVAEMSVGSRAFSFIEGTIFARWLPLRVPRGDILPRFQG